MAGESSSLRKSKRKAVEPAAPVETAPSPSLKRKKSSAEVVAAEPEAAPPPTKSRKKAKKDEAAEVPVEAVPPVAEEEPKKKEKKKKTAKAVEEVAPEPEATLPPTKLKKSKAPAPEPPAEVPKPAAKKSKKAAKAPEPEPSPEPAEASDEDEEDAPPLHGFTTDDDDSSDDDDDAAMAVEESPFDVAKLPTIAKDDATVKRKLEKAKRAPTGDRGVVFLGRIPHGFYEDQLRAYFTQFGNITRLRLSRNKRTGASKHYAFLEFDSSSTMDNYLLMGHILRCKLVPRDEVHPELWVGANRKWREVPTARVANVEHNKLRTKDEQLRAAHRLLKRQQERQRKLAKAGHRI
ncbi:hypothetical protein C8J57DRAFT_1289686 [Mycena rebaudengoi]|nr:hypothetical protein C8J57DRAFT_1289686 [Mycena rebaudengoi]